MIYWSNKILLVSAAALVLIIYIIDKANMMHYSIVDPIFNFSLAILFSSFALYFTKSRVALSWVKFASWAIPVSLLYIFLIPANSSNIMSGLTGREPTSILLASVFLSTSLILIVYKSWKLRVHEVH